jgi:hypothetical protein
MGESVKGQKLFATDFADFRRLKPAHRKENIRSYLIVFGF